MINILIVDDEQFSVDALKKYALQIPFLNVVLATTSTIEASIAVQKQQIDVVFSDIHMPELSGLELVRLIQGKSKVIFATAYSDYALEGYQNDVIDYLIKPITFEKFLRAAQKAKNLIDLEKNSLVSKEEKSIHEDFIFVKTESRGKFLKIRFDDILFIEGTGNYVTIWKINKEKIIAQLTFKYLEDFLPHNLFVRVHKSYIISLRCISGFDGSSVFLGDVTIPVGITYKEQVLNYVLEKVI
jgi:DNA-binding LytR/AlgR family response regulator